MEMLRIILLLKVAIAQVFNVDMCYELGNSGESCLSRGQISVAEASLSFKPDQDFVSIGASSLRSVVAQGASSVRVVVRSVSGAELIASLSNAELTGKDLADHIGLILSPTRHPVGLLYSVRNAIGAPLFSSLMTSLVSSDAANGPIVPKVAPGIVTGDKTEKPEGEPEEPSFIRKYWWVILALMLVSSAMGGSGEPAAPAKAAGPAAR